MKRALLVVLAACSSSYQSGSLPSWVSDTGSYTPRTTTRTSFIDAYREPAARIITAARADRGAYQKLAHLTDRIGHRLSGSPELDRAIAWAAQAMKEDGHDVRTEPVMVPHWVRGAEDAAITAPIQRPLHLIGLGGTVATPRGGITAPVVVIRSWEQLEQQADKVKGAIVLYDVAMPAWTEENGSGYGDVVQFRTKGPSRAAKLGAAAVLMRSVTARSLRTAHTGTLSYDDKLPKIPAAAVTVEDSLLLARLAEQSAVTVRLHLESQALPDAKSANVIGELRGRELPDEVVVIGGHIDSWDVGQGAHDDGAGIVTMMQALTTLRKLGLTPRRTIRVVLFTNEENGTRGAKAYAEAHAAELSKTVLAIESDSGGFSPRGFSISSASTAPSAGRPQELRPGSSASTAPSAGRPQELRPGASKSERAQARLADIASLLAPLGATRVRAGHGGADIEPMEPGGVPTVGLEVDNRAYFDYHHSEADTLDKVDPQQLADDVAAVAVVAYIVADLPSRIDAP